MVALDGIPDKKGLGRFRYQWNPGSEKDFSLALRSMMESVDATRAFGDSSPIVRVAIDALTRPIDGGPSILESLESDSLLETLNHTLSLVSASHWIALKKLLFEDLEIVELAETLREAIKGAFYGERFDLWPKVDALIDLIPYLEEWDVSEDGKPPAFRIYHSVLRSMSNDAIPGISAVAELVTSSGALESENGRPVYPSFVEICRLGAPLAATTYWLASIPEGGAWRFSAIVSQMVAGHGWKLHLEATRQLLKGTGSDLALLAKRGESSFFPVDFDDSEIDWALHFVRSGGFAKTWNYWKHNIPTGTVRAAISEVRELARKGDLARPLELMTRFEDERLAAIGELLWKWHQSGELMAFLDIAETILLETTQDRS